MEEKTYKLIFFTKSNNDVVKVLEANKTYNWGLLQTNDKDHIEIYVSLSAYQVKDLKKEVKQILDIDFSVCKL